MPEFACSVYGAPYLVAGAAADCVCYLTQVMACLVNALLPRTICCLALGIWLLFTAGVRIKLSPLEP